MFTLSLFEDELKMTGALAVWAAGCRVPAAKLLDPGLPRPAGRLHGL